MKKRLALAAMAMLGGVFAAPVLAQTSEPPKDDRFPDTPPKASKGKSESGFYAGGGINLFFVDKDAASSGLPFKFIDQPSPATLSGRLGYAINKYIAVEVEGGIGGAKSKYEINGSKAGEIGMKSEFSAHAVVSLPLGGSGVYLMGRGGYTTFTLEREYRGFSAPDVEGSGPSFGAGIGVRTGVVDYRFEYNFVSSDKANSGVLGMMVMAHF